MAWRQLHDDVPVSKTLARLSDPAERLYFRLLSQTDQSGRLTGDVDKIRMIALPSLPWDDRKLFSALQELEQVDAVSRYRTGDMWVTQVTNFDARQPFTVRKRKPSRYPDRTPDSLSPTDLVLPLPLPDDDGLRVSPEGLALGLPAGDLALPHGGPGACGLGLSYATCEPAPAETPASSANDNRETEDRDRKETVSPTAVASSEAGLPVEHSPESGDVAGRAVSADGVGLAPDDLAAVAGRLRDADGGTVNVLARLRRELPVAAFYSALEGLEERRGKEPPLQSDVRYFVATLRAMVREGQYPQGAAA